MRFLFVFFFLFLSMGFVYGQNEDFIMPKGLIVALPKSNTVKVEWVAPPLAKEQVDKAGFFDQKFRMDSQGAVWMLHNRKFLTNFASGAAFSVTRPVMDFIFMDDGALFIISDT